MRTRDDVLVYQELQTPDKSTKTIDLKLVDPVSALSFEFEATNGSTSNVLNPFPFVPSKLEVVDGSDVLASLSFPEAQALQFYKTGKQPELREDEVGGSQQVIGCSILFGRYLYDKMFALDLTKFRNPQLKISWDLAVTRAVHASTAFATGKFMISAWAKSMENMGPVPGSFLMAKEIDSFTGSGSGDVRKDLPRDFPYHLLMLRGYNRGYEVEEAFTKFKLVGDITKTTIMERYVKQFNAEMAQLFGQVHIWKRFMVKHNDTIWFEVNKEPQIKVMVTALGRIMASGWCWAGNANVTFCDHAGTPIGAAERVDYEIDGYSLHHTMPIPLGIMDDPDTWFDPTGFGKLELVLTSGNASANAIVAEQVRPNAPR